MTAAATSIISSSQSSKHSNQTHQFRRERKISSSNPTHSKRTRSSCHISYLSIVSDIAILIVVVLACGYLTFPYLVLLYHGAKIALLAIETDFPESSFAIQWVGVGFLVLSFLCFLLIRCLIGDDVRCDNPKCKGLIDGREFNIKIETEDCLKNSSGGEKDVNVTNEGPFELDEENHRRLGKKLRKLAPPNGRAMLIFRASCGCSLRRMVVWGSKKNQKGKK